VDQPHYPYTFHNADALTYPLDGFDAIHASPPCQEHSTLRTKTTQRGKAYLLNATLERLASVSVPWIVENVVGTSVEMNGWYVTLCGTTFGLGVRRHRRFGSNVLLLTAECTHYLQPEPIDVTGGGPSHTVRTTVGGRSRKAGIAKARQAMGIDWPMTRAELAQAIPPAYTEYLGAQLLQYVKA
jgi:DNA (cytosine-5)-methyltransferase 1